MFFKSTSMATLCFLGLNIAAASANTAFAETRLEKVQCSFSNGAQGARFLLDTTNNVVFSSDAEWNTREELRCESVDGTLACQFKQPRFLPAGHASHSTFSRDTSGAMNFTSTYSSCFTTTTTTQTCVSVQDGE